jgi:hypothetical protein
MWADVNRYEGWIAHQGGAERYGGYTDTKPAGEHDHTGSSVGNTGGGQAFDVLPSYYSVIYIRKCV